MILRLKKVVLALSLVGGTMASLLEQARNLSMPVVESTEGGELEHSEFWETHAALLRGAWKEWEEEHAPRLPVLDESCLDPALRDAVRAAWKDPRRNEAELLEFLQPIEMEGVFRCQLFTVDGVRRIRTYLDAASEAGIPTRRPNGMNRYGLILDTATDGSIHLSALDEFYQTIIDDYFRPMSRALFPDFSGPDADDEKSYGFTIRYRADLDMALREHSDASLFTLNVNLNFQEESYSGSSLYFVDDQQSQHNVSFGIGEAFLHRGLTRHAALPITEGTRTNLVLWLFGAYGYVRIVPYETHERRSVHQRWQKVQRDEL